MQSLTLLRHPTLWGAAALALATAVGLVAACFISAPQGRRPSPSTPTMRRRSVLQTRCELPVSQWARSKTCHWKRTSVRVRARVDGDAFVGDQSQLEVRMLTVVGGYYVNIVPLGDAPLGAKPIPLERVTMPYNLMRTLADSTKITENVNA